MGKGLGFRVSGLGFSSTLQCPDPSSSLVVLDGGHVCKITTSLARLCSGIWGATPLNAILKIISVMLSCKSSRALAKSCC